MKIYPALVSSLLFPRFENILKNIHKSESKTKIVFVPGRGVNPYKYKNILSNIKDNCNQKNPDIYIAEFTFNLAHSLDCLLYTSPSPRDATLSRMPSSA